jgi:hypothetical protein
VNEKIGIIRLLLWDFSFKLKLCSQKKTIRATYKKHHAHEKMTQQSSTKTQNEVFFTHFQDIQKRQGAWFVSICIEDEIIKSES